MSFTLLLLALLASPAEAERETRIRSLIENIAQSGRVLEIGEAGERLADPRKQVAPGAPPLLAFRYFEGAERHRFGNLDLILDDAGH
ncbi:MAG TPA: hypothetical protein VFL57_08305 [Bryobacteraceae bacterium]|nr:hypothetical protein [Bryobacteraceae bacterium]